VVVVGITAAERAILAEYVDIAQFWGYRVGDGHRGIEGYLNDVSGGPLGYLYHAITPITDPLMRCLSTIAAGKPVDTDIPKNMYLGVESVRNLADSIGRLRVMAALLGQLTEHSTARGPFFARVAGLAGRYGSGTSRVFRWTCFAASLFVDLWKQNHVRVIDDLQRFEAGGYEPFSRAEAPATGPPSRPEYVALAWRMRQIRGTFDMARARTIWPDVDEPVGEARQILESSMEWDRAMRETAAAAAPATGRRVRGTGMEMAAAAAAPPARRSRRAAKKVPVYHESDSDEDV
jgi:hypothetical protein